MKTRLIFLALQFWFLGQALMLPAAPIRVTTWDLQPGAAAGTNGWSTNFQLSLVQDAAESLKKLRPDVILLQNVADWQTCHQLAQALRPEVYQVATCSSWHDPRAKNSSPQVAILSKARAYLSWSEPWQNSGQFPVAPGGFAFAAMRLGGKSIGVFSVQLVHDAALQQTGEESARQLFQQITLLQNWKINRLEGCIVAANDHENAFARLEQLGFENASARVLFTRDTGRVSPPLMAHAAHCEYDALTFEMDLAAPKPAVNPPIHPLAAVTPAKAPAPATSHQTLLWLAGFAAGCLALFILVRTIARRPSFQPASTQVIVRMPAQSPPYVQIEMEGSTQTQSQTWRPRPAAARLPASTEEAVRAGVIANLSRWLKQKVAQRLVSDRAQLLATQEAASLKMQAVDERLAKIECHIQQRNQDYERRIDELLKALITAEEENRELIRAQIALLKAEQEKAKLLAEQRRDELGQY